MCFSVSQFFNILRFSLAARWRASRPSTLLARLERTSPWAPPTVQGTALLCRKTNLRQTPVPSYCPAGPRDTGVPAPLTGEYPAVNRGPVSAALPRGAAVAHVSRPASGGHQPPRRNACGQLVWSGQVSNGNIEICSDEMAGCVPRKGSSGGGFSVDQFGAAGRLRMERRSSSS